MYVCVYLCMHIQILDSKYHSPVKELGLLQEMADFKAMAKKIQDEPGKVLLCF